MSTCFTARISEEKKQQLYVFLLRIPILSYMLKSYIQKTSPIWLVSFKKTGRTWLRVLIGKALQLHFGVDESVILHLPSRKDKKHCFSGIAFVHDDAAHWKKPDELHESKEHFKFKKIILLVRDPRDIVVSNFFENTKRLKSYINGEKLDYPKVKDRITPYSGSLSSYIREPVGGFDTIAKFYSIWAQNRQLLGDTLLIVRYEDLHVSPLKELRRIMDFIGLENVCDMHIEEAVAYASFEKMKKRELENKGKSIKISAVDVKDEESYKTRKGKVGGFAEYLSDEDINFLNDKMRENFSSLYGYIV